MKEDRGVEQSPVKGVTGKRSLGLIRVDVFVMGDAGIHEKSNAAPGHRNLGSLKTQGQHGRRERMRMVVFGGLVVLLKERKLRKIREKGMEGERGEATTGSAGGLA